MHIKQDNICEVLRIVPFSKFSTLSSLLSFLIGMEPEFLDYELRIFPLGNTSQAQILQVI